MKYLLILLMLSSCSWEITYHTYQCKISPNDVKAAAIQSGLTIEHATENSITATQGGINKSIYNFVITDTLMYYTISFYADGTFLGYADKPKYNDSFYGVLAKNLSKHCEPKYYKIPQEQDIYQVMYAKP